MAGREWQIRHACRESRMLELCSGCSANMCPDKDFPTFRSELFNSCPVCERIPERTDTRDSENRTLHLAR